MTNSPQLLDFPAKFVDWQPGQSQTIDELSTSKHRIKCLSAPTGAGKTAVAIAYARQNNLRFAYLTKDLKLQTQISGEFATIADLRGRSHYPCISQLTSASNCGVAPCLDGKSCEHKKRDCKYDVAFLRATQQSWGMVTNFAKWSALINPAYGKFHGGSLGPIDLLIIDEGHTIDDHLTNQCSIDINASSLYDLLDNKTKLPVGVSAKLLTLWAKNAHQLAQIAYMAHKDHHTRQEIIHLGRQLGRLMSAVHPWIIDKSTSEQLHARPLWPRAFVENHLMAHIPNVLIMSATLTEKYIKRLGIDDYSYHYMNSNFDPARRPFYYLDQQPNVAMNFKTSTEDKQIVYDRVGATLRSFKNHNTIVHSVSHNRTRECCSMLRNVDEINVHQSFERFMNSKLPTTLVSASISQGVDLPDDMCRLGQMIKVPYAPLHDKLIAARRADDSSYYADIAADQIMQQVGRTTRNVDDWSVNVIHDANFVKLLRHAHFEPWFLDAVECIDHIPKPLEV